MSLRHLPSSRPAGWLLWALVALQPVSPAFATIYTWNVAAGGLTNTTVNWSPNTGIPGANDDTRFFQTVTYTVTTASPADTFATLWASSTGHPQFSCSDPMRVRNAFQVDGAVTASIIGGTVHAGWFTVGPGTLTITGSSTQVNATNPAAYSYFGNSSGFTSTVNVSGGAAFTGSNIQVPQIQGALGILNVAGHPTGGPSSTLHALFTSGFTGNLEVGVQGTGDVELFNGGVIVTDDELWLGSNGVGKLHMYRNSILTPVPTLDVRGYTRIGENVNAGSPGGQGTFAMDLGIATFHQPILMGDDDGGSADTLRMNGGTVVADVGLFQNATNTSLLDLHGGSLRVLGSDNFDGSPYAFLLVNQTVPLTLTGAGGGPTLTVHGGIGHQVNTTTPLSLVLGRNGGGTLRSIGDGSFFDPTDLEFTGSGVVADSLTGTGTLIADTSGFVGFGGTLAVGPGNGMVEARRGGGIGVRNGRTDVLAGASTGGTILVSDSLTEGLFYALNIGGTNSAATPGPALVKVDSLAALVLDVPGIKIWGGGGRLYVGAGAAAYVDSLVCNGEIQLANGRVQTGSGLGVYHVANGGSLHGTGTVHAAVSLEDATATLGILAGDPPGDTLAVGDSTRTGAFSSHGTVRVETDTLALMSKGGVDLGHVVLAGGTLRLPNGGHLRPGDLLEGAGRLEGNVVDDGVLNASLSLDVTGHLTCLDGNIAGPGTNLLPGSELSARGTLSGAVRVGGKLDMGPALAKLTLQAAPNLLPGGVVTLRIGAASAHAQDTLAVGQSLPLAGTLDLRTWSPTPPVVGDTLTLITAPSISGTFGTVTIDGVVAPSFVQTIYTPTSVRVAILQATSAVPPASPPPATPLALRFASAGTLGDPGFALDLPQASDVRIAVYDVAGRQVADLADGPLAAGRHRFALAGAPGVYFGRAWIRDGSGEHLLGARAVRLR